MTNDRFPSDYQRSIALVLLIVCGACVASAKADEPATPFTPPPIGRLISTPAKKPPSPLSIRLPAPSLMSSSRPAARITDNRKPKVAEPAIAQAPVSQPNTISPTSTEPAHHGLGANPSASYERAKQLEARGEVKGAMSVYQASAEAGFGPAQKRLGNLYGGNADVPRDYAKAIYWHRKARESGETIDPPQSYSVIGGTR